jgi:dopachrome tautomerase
VCLPDENPDCSTFSFVLISVEETPGWTTTLSIVMGTLVALVGLFVLLVFFQYRRLRKGYTPLMETHLNNKRYSDDA